MTKEELIEKLRECDLNTIKNVNSYIVKSALNSGLYLNDEEVKEVYEALNVGKFDFVDYCYPMITRIKMYNDDLESGYAIRIFNEAVKNYERNIKYTASGDEKLRLMSKTFEYWKEHAYDRL